MNTKECDRVRHQKTTFINASLVLYILNDKIIINKGKIRAYLEMSEEIEHQIRGSRIAVERQMQFLDHMRDTR